MDSRPVAFFDFDDTLVFGDSMLHWQRWYARRRHLWGVGPWIWLSVAMRLLGKPSVWLKRAYMATANRETPDSRTNLVRQFSREFLSQCGLTEIIDRVWMHHALGHRIVVVTASPSFYLWNLDDILPPHDLVATELEFHGRNLWNLPRVSGHNVKGEGKLNALAERGCTFPMAGSFAYSDHISDAPLLEAVEFAFAVRPDEELEILARQKGWPILRPVEPWGEGKTRLAKLFWLVLGPLGPRWPFLQLPKGKGRRRLWRRWAKVLVKTWKEASRENRQEFGELCRELERISTRLKGAAPRMARALVEKPLVHLGHPAQPGLDRIWATGQSLGLAPEALDALQRMVYQAPGCESARLVPASVSSDGLFQTYRVQRQSGSDRVLKLLLPGAEVAAELDMEPGVADSLVVHDQVLRRAWEGLLSELRPTFPLECDLPRERRIGRVLGDLFRGRQEGIWIPAADLVADGGFQGLVMEATDGFTFSSYLAYLRETRRLRDPKAEPTPDYIAFAALIANAPPLPQDRELTQRLWTLVSRSWYERAVWIALSGVQEVRVVPREDGWLLSMSDFAGAVEFPDWCPHALREWDVVCPEGSSDLAALCRAMGWGDHHLEAFHGRHRELVEMVWHPILRGSDATGFAFDDWRLDGRLQSLLGVGHQHENWPVPDPCRSVFRSLRWLRRGLASIGEPGTDGSGVRNLAST
ncbi:MAG TPA: HAD-IB family phosphatase [Fibrobacteria bacterium]|nr:HAD-IB family phosphatase [Fibrobacteria bacterium]